MQIDARLLSCDDGRLDLLTQAYVTIMLTNFRQHGLLEVWGPEMKVQRIVVILERVWVRVLVGQGW